MELLHEHKTARKVSLLGDSQIEVLVLTSRKFLENWSPELLGALGKCRTRGVRVHVLVERGRPFPTQLQGLVAIGAEVRYAKTFFSPAFHFTSLQGEIWIIDRNEIVATNQSHPRSPSPPDNWAMECRLGPTVATGAASYFDMRWDSASAPVAFSVRHKQFSFHSGHQSEAAFFSCLVEAKKEVVICLPGGEVSPKLERSLLQALAEGLKVTIYANADRDSSRHFRRLRRLVNSGVSVKICGARLSPECALIDSGWVYMGSLPRPWRPWTSPACPVFLVNNTQISHEIRAALESQVSVEFSPLLEAVSLR